MKRQVLPTYSCRLKEFPYVQKVQKQVTSLDPLSEGIVISAFDHDVRYKDDGNGDLTDYFIPGKLRAEVKINATHTYYCVRYRLTNTIG